jgi:hypothetical protein
MRLDLKSLLLGAAIVALASPCARAADDPVPTPGSSRAVAPAKPSKRAPVPTPTPNPKLVPPDVKMRDVLPSIAPATLPDIKFPERVTPSPTPDPGVMPKDPTAAALFSAFVPGLGHVYAKEPLKGVFFAAAFGLSLYLSVDNFRLESEPNSDERVARNETAGSLYGLAALAAYGFSIQDAYNSARRHNRRHHLSVAFEPVPHPRVAFAVRF